MSETIITVLVLAGSGLGIALLVLMNMAVGGWTPLRFFTPGQALTYLQRDVMGFESGPDYVLADAGEGALFVEQDGARLGLVLAQRDKAVVRALRPADVRAATANGANLVLCLSDYTFPQAVLGLSRESEAEQWAEKLTVFATGAAASKEAEHAATA